MKKSILFYVYYGIALLVIFVNSFFLIKDNFFINIESVPEGEYQYSDFSPRKSTELKVYLVELPVGESVRISLTKEGDTRNLFWQAGVSDVKIKWRNENRVEINGIDLDLKQNETFDSRSISSIFNDGLMGR
ncbi:MAG: hypothetical protein E7537_04125 [Ruminococcaceae bacterium]|nr:hypothetical protein [Oscillospiraceae bacterium]